jgi:hypothetical protein
MVREAFEQELNEWVAKVKKEGPLREDVLYKVRGEKGRHFRFVP